MECSTRKLENSDAYTFSFTLQFQYIIGIGNIRLQVILPGNKPRNRPTTSTIPPTHILVTSVTVHTSCSQLATIVAIKVILLCGSEHFFSIHIFKYEREIWETF